MATSNAAGARLQIHAYDPYGVTAASNTGRFQYTGQAAIPELGLLYYKARYYNPSLGRFMQTDPIGYEDDLNLYAYVGNDPLNKTDPSGNAAFVIPVIVACVESQACTFAALAVAAAVGIEAGKVYNESGSSALATSPNSDAPSSSDNPAGTTKGPPNPNGSKGGEAHQGKIKERIQELKHQGHTHVAGGDKPEETVDTSGGNKESRRPDITTRDPNGKPYRENVGRQNKDGTPVSRERKAQEDIRNATGQCAFTPYNCK